MNKTIKRFASLQQLKAHECLAWREVSPAERLRAVTEISAALYAVKGSMPDVRRLKGSAIRLQRR